VHCTEWNRKTVQQIVCTVHGGVKKNVKKTVEKQLGKQRALYMCGIEKLFKKQLALYRVE